MYFVACFSFQTQAGVSSKTLGSLWYDGPWVQANSWDSDRDQRTLPLSCGLIFMLIPVPLVIQDLKFRVSVKLPGEAIFLVYLELQSPTLQLSFILNSRRLTLINSHCCCFCKGLDRSSLWMCVSQLIILKLLKWKIAIYSPLLLLKVNMIKWWWRCKGTSGSQSS